MSKVLSRTFNEMKAVALCGLAVLVVQWVSFISSGTTMEWGKAIVGMLMIVLICVISLRIKASIPLKIPAFAWASLIAMLITMPFSPIQETALHYINAVSMGQISTLILAVAGISIGTRLDDIKRLSWKMILVAIVVFIGTFFGSAIISQIVLQFQGLI